MFLNDPNLLIARCGCQQNLGLEPVDQGPYTCCEDCPDAPCLYSIIFPCRIVDPATGEPLLEKCTLLRKDCIVGCGWSSRWKMATADDVTTDFPLLSPTDCRLAWCGEGVAGCDGCDDLPDCIDMEVTSLTGGFVNPDLCYDCIGEDEPLECDSGDRTDFVDRLPRKVRLRRIGSSCSYDGQLFCWSLIAGDRLDWESSVIDFRLTITPTGSQIQAVQWFGNAATLWFDNPLGAASDNLTLACTVGGNPVGSGLTSTIDGFAFSVSGWNLGTSPYPGVPTSGFAATLHEVPDCGISDDGSSDVSSIDTGKVKISVGSIPCHWPDPIPELSEGEVVPADDDPDQFKKWTLSHDETVSTLTLTTRDDRTAVYTADRSAIVADCRDPITYHQQSADSGLEKLPLALCVVPIESRPKIVCETAEDQCGCCEKGDDLPYRVYLVGCENIVSTASGIATRITDADDLPCGVAWPSSAPCGVFPILLGGAESCGDWTGAVLLLAYCTGNTYAIDVYCYDGETECWVYQGAATITFYECRCGGPLFAMTLPPLDCCCAAGCPSDPATDFPSGTVTLSSTCADLDGCDVTVTYLMGAWTGVATCGGLSVFISVSCGGDGTGWQLVIGISGCGIPNNDNGYTTELDEVAKTLTAVWDDFVVAASDAGCCGGVDITVGAVFAI